VLTCDIPNLPLPIGQYCVNAKLELNGEEADFVPELLVFDVDASSFFRSGHTPSVRFCTCMIQHSWRQRTQSADELILNHA
jgi:hypothetical protein